MGHDRFIRWDKKRPEWGNPTIEKLAVVAQDFLGPLWTVRQTHETWLVCETDDLMTFALRSERDDPAKEDQPGGRTMGEAMYQDAQTRTRGFEVFFLVEKGRIKQTSVITRSGDDFTNALADRYAAIIARWWHGRVESG